MDSAERKQQRKHWFYGDKAVDLAERNSDEFPLGLLARSASTGEKRLEFEGHVTDSSTGERFKRNLVISANVDTDLPSYWDIDVQKALLALSHRQNRYEFPERVEFTIYQVLKLMRKANATANIRRIAKSLDNWNGVRFKYSHWWTGDSWDHPKAFVLLQDYDLSRRGKGARTPDTPQVFTWSRHYVESIRAAGYKPFDADFYFSLEKPTTRRLFTLLDKKLAARSHYKHVDLADFARNNVGLGQRRPSQYPERLRDAYDELVSRGFLARMTDGKRFGGDGDYFFYCKRGKGEKSRSQVSVPVEVVADKECATGLEAELERRGVLRGKGKTMSSGLVASASDELIRNNCERYDVLVEEGCDVTPALLAFMIRDGNLIQIPKGKQTATEKKRKVELSRKLTERRADLEKAGKAWSALAGKAPREAFENLSDEQREEILSEAIASAKPFYRTRLSESEEGTEEHKKILGEILVERWKFVYRKCSSGADATPTSMAWYETFGVRVGELKKLAEWAAYHDAKSAFEEADKAYEAVK